MCVSTTEANFLGTKIYVGLQDHPNHGLIWVLTYSNQAVSYSGPNAMLLHMWPPEEMTPENFINTIRCPEILNNMVTAFQPVTRGGTSRSAAVSKSPDFQFFKLGIYDVVLAKNALVIREALKLVAARKRPVISDLLINYYAQELDGATIALCCFDNTDVKQGQPLMMWYKADIDYGFAPELAKDVDVDHWLFASMPDMHYGQSVTYTDPNIPAEIRTFLPNRVVGLQVSGKMRNGDFHAPLKTIQSGVLRLLDIQRVHPNPASGK